MPSLRSRLCRCCRAVGNLVSLQVLFFLMTWLYLVRSCSATVLRLKQRCATLSCNATHGLSLFLARHGLPVTEQSNSPPHCCVPILRNAALCHLTAPLPGSGVIEGSLAVWQGVVCLTYSFAHLPHCAENLGHVSVLCWRLEMIAYASLLPRFWLLLVSRKCIKSPR